MNSPARIFVLFCGKLPVSVCFIWSATLASGTGGFKIKLASGEYTRWTFQHNELDLTIRPFRLPKVIGSPFTFRLDLFTASLQVSGIKAFIFDGDAITMKKR